MFDKSRIKKILSDNYPLLSIIIGIVLVSAAIGPFENGDTEWEFQATEGVIRWGMPYVKDSGNIMDQPPLGFYAAALFFKIFGASADIGVILVTLFGLGTTVLLYKIGKAVYSKTTGLIAAALFALTPWQLILSRTFLIDAQCLFFSLLCLFVGISATRKDSLKLSMVSGVIFAAALLTKLYAAFILIPLVLFYIFHQQKSLKRTFIWLGTFFLPAIVLVFLWYQIISGQGLLSIFGHGDFSNPNYSGIVPSYFFVIDFLGEYGLGWFFMATAALSVGICFFHRKQFSKILLFDLICLVIILAVVIVNTVLGAGLNLKSPYNNAIKFDYQLVPFFSLLAASIASKGLSLVRKTKSKRNKLPVLIFAVVGIVLLGTSMIDNMGTAQQLATSDYLLFRVERSVDVGYSLFNPDPIGNNSLLKIAQYIGFAFIISGLLWTCRHELWNVFNPMRNWIEKKNVLT